MPSSAGYHMRPQLDLVDLGHGSNVVRNSLVGRVHEGYLPLWFPCLLYSCALRIKTIL